MKPSVFQLLEGLSVEFLSRTGRHPAAISVHKHLYAELITELKATEAISNDQRDEWLRMSEIQIALTGKYVKIYFHQEQDLDYVILENKL